MRSKGSVSLASYVLVSLSLPMALVVIASAWQTYLALESTILHGFDQKLSAVSTAAAAGISGDEHQRIIEKRLLQGLGFNPHKELLLSVDTRRGEIVSLAALDGRVVREVPIRAPEEVWSSIRGVTFQPSTQMLLVSVSRGSELLALNSETGQVRQRWKLPEPLGAISWDSEEGRLYGASTDSILKISLSGKTAKVESRRPLEGAAAVASSVEGRTLFVAEGEALLRRFSRGKDLVGKELEPLALREASDSELTLSSAAVESAEQNIPLGRFSPPIRGLVSADEPGTLYALTDQLVKVSLSTGVVDAVSFSVGFRNEDSPRYRSVAAPLEYILSHAGLTYLYTIVPFGNTSIMYGVDATQTEDHSPVATVESNPAQEAARLLRVMHTSIPSVSDVQQFDIWGKLKTGSAPILTHDGTASALLGADVNISMIDQRTTEALLLVFGLGGLLLGAGLGVAVTFASRLSKSTTHLRDSALAIAAGEFEYKIPSLSLRELSLIGHAVDRSRRGFMNCRKGECAIEEPPEFFSVTDREEAHVKRVSNQGNGEKLNLLGSNAVFRVLPQEALQILSSVARLVEVSPGQVLCRAHCISPFVVVVESGEVLADLSYHHTEVVALREVLIGQPLNEEIRVSRGGAAKVLLISREHILTLASEFPEFVVAELELHVAQMQGTTPERRC